MKCLLLTGALIASSSAAQSPAAQPHPPRYVSLGYVHDRNRVLMVFANGNNQLAEAQLTVASKHMQEFKDRDLLLVGIQGENPDAPTALLPPADDVTARKRFHVKPGQFTVVLIGKDGGEKMRSNQPIPWDKLQATIDAMPMRQDEVQRGKR